MAKRARFPVGSTRGARRGTVSQVCGGESVELQQLSTSPNFCMLDLTDLQDGFPVEHLVSNREIGKPEVVSVVSHRGRDQLSWNLSICRGCNAASSEERDFAGD